MMTVCTGSKAYDCYLDLLDYGAGKEMDHFSMTFEHWQKLAANNSLPKIYDHLGGSFMEYSEAVILETRRRASIQAEAVQNFEDAIIALLSMAALLCTLLASRYWCNIARSQKLTLYAWGCMVVAPFIGSMVPARQFVNFANSDDLMVAYTHSVYLQFQVDNRMNDLVDSCGDLREGGLGHVENGKQKFGKICGWVGKLPRGSIKFPRSWRVWDDWINVPTEPAHESCEKGQDAIEKGDPEKALEQAKEACDTLDDVMKEYEKEDGETPSKVIAWLVNYVRDAAESSVIFTLGLRNLGALLPAALSIAPGMLKGAVRLKLLVPQSGIPGMFVLILPLMFCPLQWCICSLISHLVGSWLLLIGLMVLVYAPMIWIFIGGKKNLDRPLTDDQASDAIMHVNRAMIAVYTTGAILVIAWGIQMAWWIHKTHQANQEAADDSFRAKKETELVEEALKSVKKYYSSNPFKTLVLDVLLVVCSCLEKYYLTSLAGFDWMVGRLCNLRRIERDRDDELSSEYQQRMDQMLSLSSGKKYNEWVDNEWKEHELKQRRKKWQSSADHPGTTATQSMLSS